MDVVNELPSRMFKAFSRRDHADALLKGTLRLGRLETCRAIEGSRRDEAEGEARLKVPALVTSLDLAVDTLEVVGESAAPGYLDFGSSYANPVFVFCASGPDVELHFLRSRFGAFVVEIFDPTALLAALVDALPSVCPAQRELFFVDACAVQYTKGEVGTPSKARSIRLSIAQKAARFAPEREYRIAVSLSGSPYDLPDAFFLSLNHPESFCCWAASAESCLAV